MPFWVIAMLDDGNCSTDQSLNTRELHVHVCLFLRRLGGRQFIHQFIEINLNEVGILYPKCAIWKIGHNLFNGREQDLQFLNDSEICKKYIKT